MPLGGLLPPRVPDSRATAREQQPPSPTLSPRLAPRRTDPQTLTKRSSGTIRGATSRGERFSSWPWTGELGVRVQKRRRAELQDAAHLPPSLATNLSGRRSSPPPFPCCYCSLSPQTQPPHHPQALADLLHNQPPCVRLSPSTSARPASRSATPAGSSTASSTASSPMAR